MQRKTRSIQIGCGGFWTRKRRGPRGRMRAGRGIYMVSLLRPDSSILELGLWRTTPRNGIIHCSVKHAVISTMVPVILILRPSRSKIQKTTSKSRPRSPQSCRLESRSFSAKDSARASEHRSAGWGWKFERRSRCGEGEGGG